MNNLDKQYQDLLQDILDNGTKKGDRTGTGTLSVFGRQIRHKMSEGFPLITTKKMPFKTIATELIWFLKGDTNIKYLVDNGCNIWNGDAYKNYITTLRNEKLAKEKKAREEGFNLILEYGYLTSAEFVEQIKTDDEFAKKWGELGPVYGRQWRKWSAYNEYDAEPELIDQIRNLVEDLKNNPDSRRLMVNAWNVGEIDQMVLPPCHYGFQVYTRDLTRSERWDWLKRTSWDNKWTIPWDRMALPAHEWFDGYTQVWGTNEPIEVPKRAISLIWNQRSVDTFLGLPFNIASYGLLLEILAKEVNMVPDELIGNLGDTHLYLNHIEQAKEVIGKEMTLSERTDYAVDSLGFNALLDYGHSQNDDELILEFLNEHGVPRISRIPYLLPKVNIRDSWKYGSSSPVFADKLKLDMFELVDYKSHGTIKAPLSN